MFRSAYVIAALLALALVACEGPAVDDPGEASDRLKAQAVVMTLLGDDPNTAPEIGTTYDCVITILHRQLLATPRGPVAGRCLWTVEKQGEGWRVKFREQWSCSEWSAVVAGYPPCSELTGFHQWEYLVDIGGPVQDLDETGQFAPDM